MDAERARERLAKAPEVEPRPGQTRRNLANPAMLKWKRALEQAGVEFQDPTDTGFEIRGSDPKRSTMDEA
jgi:hypothetical protein